MLRRFISAALSGTTIDRKITTNSRNDSRITAAMNSGRRSVTRSLTSAKLAVCPPMWARAGLAPRARGTTSFRRRASVSRVASSCGPVVGIATSVATPAAASTAAGATVAMPASARTASRSGSTTLGSRAMSTAMTSGPLLPGPNPAATRS